jgi:hypothetical protein
MTARTRHNTCKAKLGVDLKMGGNILLRHPEPRHGPEFATLYRPAERSCGPQREGHRMTRRSQTPPPVPASAPAIPKIPPTDVLGRLAALKVAPTDQLKRQWRELFGKEPPPWNRAYIQSRLAYRIQELAYGALKPETVDRLVALGKQLDGGNVGGVGQPRP